MGRGSSIFSGREVYRREYTDKFDKLLLREAGNIYYRLYYDDRNDHYFCYLKMPSEKDCELSLHHYLIGLMILSAQTRICRGGSVS